MPKAPRRSAGSTFNKLCDRYGMTAARGAHRGQFSNKCVGFFKEHGTPRQQQMAKAAQAARRRSVRKAKSR